MIDFDNRDFGAYEERNHPGDDYRKKHRTRWDKDRSIVNHIRRKPAKYFFFNKKKKLK